MDRQRQPDMSALIRDAARASGSGAGWLDALLAGCWPGGEDRSEPAARVWVRAWGAPRAGLTRSLPTACSCASGRCGVCN